CELPRSDLLYLRLRATGAVFYRARFLALINELIQSGFILSSTPELQNTEYRVQKEEKENILKEKEEAVRTVPVGNDERVRHRHLVAQANPTAPPNSGFVPRVTAGTTQNHFTYEEATARISGPPPSRFEKTQRNDWEPG